MNYAALAFLTLGLSAGQVPNGYQALKSRSLKLDLDVDPKQQAKVSHIELFVSRDRGGVWESVAQARPDAKFIPYAVKEDGLYWISIVTVYKDGKQDPPNVAAVPPMQKLLIDATPPVLRIRDARRDGEEVALEWSVEEAYPNDGRTKVEFRLAGGSETSWKTIPVIGTDRRSTRFNPVSSQALQVRVTVEDQAGNTATQMIDVAGTAGTMPAVASETTTLKSVTAPPLLQTPTLPVMAPMEPSVTGVVPSGPAPILDLTAKPASPPAPALVQEPAPIAAPAPIAMGAGVQPIMPISPQPLAASTPLATSSLTTATQTDMPTAQVINFVKFDLPYQIEAGPSGISRIDLYVTRDDGATWVKWSEHEGRESPLKVALDRKYNPQPEGTYGFRMVPVSGAGLSDAPPSRGTAPEFRVQVDLTPPIIKIFQPEADANARDVLVLKWEATDKNLGKEPIALEYSEGPSGPWKPVIGSDGLVPVAAATGVSGPIRIANTGSYGWKLPTNLPTHRLYLKVTAWDLAGNKSEVATPSPILVDLVKPRAKIQGLVQSTGPR